jgi:hypothetical protein
VVYGQRYVDDYESSDAVSRLVADVMATIRAAYRQAAEASGARRNAPPPEAETLRKIRAAIGPRVETVRPRSLTRP